MSKTKYILDRKFYILIISALVMQACDKHFPVSYHDTMPEPEIPESSIKKTPITVYINTADYINATSRAVGTGPFSRNDEELRKNYMNKYRQILLQTYAFRSTKNVSGRLSYDPDFSISLYENNSADDCLLSLRNGINGGIYTRFIDQYPDGETSDQEMYFYDSKTSNKPVILYYNEENIETGYNFYAYTFDNAETSEANVSNDKISYDVTIDGTNDVMVGSSPDFNINYINAEYAELPANTRKEVANIGGFSAFASHRGIDPIINLKHQLARLKFKAYPGNIDALSIDIKKIEILSNTTGKVIVAARNLEEIGITSQSNEQWLELRENSVDGIQPCKELKKRQLPWDPAEENLEPIERTPIEIGGSLMLIPKDRYSMRITMDQYVSTDGEAVKPDRSNAALDDRHKNIILLLPDITAPKVSLCYDEESEKYVFKPGFTYNIGIVMYGIEEIYVTTNIESWIYGGDINMGEIDNK